MEVDIPKRTSHTIHNYPKEDLEKARTFAKLLHKELGKHLKAIVLFGSSARKTATPKSDIDVLVIIDDLSFLVTRDVADGYRIAMQNIIAKVSRRLHVVSLRLTAYWEYMRNGDPIGINMLRDGVSLYDTGFFGPLQLLLKKGRIRPSKESIWSYYLKAAPTLNNAKWHIKQATIDLYWACIDAAHAALMSKNVIPPTPEHVADMLDEVLVKKGLLEKKYSRIMRASYYRAKQIMHSEVKDIAGADFDKFLAEADMFVNRMKKFVDL